MNRSANKASRLLRIEALLMAHPKGLTQAEIARRLGVNRSTVHRDLSDMTKWMYVDDDGRWKLDREGYEFNVRFTLHEALAIHLASRLLATRMDRQNPHAAASLRKLAAALERLAPDISNHLLRSADVMDDAAKKDDPRYLEVVEKLTLAWATRRKVHIWHRLQSSGEVYDYVFAPYFIEPYAVGQTTHVVGRRDATGKLPSAMRTFKIERIERIVLLDESYEIPDDFDPTALMADAWGIWYSDQEPVEVVLRFHRRVAGRVKESQWHRSQQLSQESDGGVIWRAKVAEPQEMLPWIRGWGADVEVLEPEALRQELVKTAVGLGRQYETMATTKSPYHIPYAKTNPDNREEIHLLLYHLIDVGQVAHILWQEVLTGSIRQRLAHMLSLNEADAGRLLAFLAGLHDLGKAGPAYQRKYAPDWLKKELNDAGLRLQDTAYSHKTTDTKTPHATVTTWALSTLLPEMTGLDERFARDIAFALGGHHGAWPPPGATYNIDDGKHDQWDKVRRDLVWELKAVFGPPAVVAPPQDQTERNTLMTIFSGFVSVADWLGSRNKECFGFVGDPMSTRQYAEQAYQKAQKSLTDLGWKGWRPTGEQQSFAETFAYLDFEAPRPVQQQVIDAARNCPQPTLLILEAPTGIGKTEAALHLADAWLQQHHGRGLYVAMPTQATSNQMFDRFLEYLGHRYPQELVNTHLVHGQAAWSDALQDIELQSIGDAKDNAEGIAAMTWFRPRKRTLLAPFGVGTVDQTLLSILQTRHFFVRLFALSHKVIIFDEVHAYDTYMNTLFHRLLEWLHAIGTSAIILSATLPADTRRALVKAYSGHELVESVQAYPALTIAGNGQEPQHIKLPVPEEYTMQLDWSVRRDPKAIGDFLKEALVDGGCTAVICNTVRRAQEIYRAIQEADMDIPQDDLILFHARFPPIWRQEIETKVLAKFGKPDKDGHSPSRPRRAIVVATQVIEQSLDLDFDLMITDLAPIDLVLQRAGRLHRHRRDAEERHGHPRRLVITQPAADVGSLPDFESDQYVYEPYILLRSYLALHDRQQISLPGATSHLIEAVYGSDDKLTVPSVQWQKALGEMRRKMNDNQQKAESKANTQLVLAPKSPRLMRHAILGLEEDNPEVHQTFRAQTRDIDPGVAVICLHQIGGETAVQDGRKFTTFDLEAVPPGLVKTLLQNMITIQHRGVIRALTDQPLPPNWRDCAGLRHTRPLLFIHDICDLPDSGYLLKLTQTLGLEIVKKEAV